jgi:protein arginine N-methyltransferase 1
MAKTLEEHHGYLADTVKLARYQAAIDKVVQPDHVVLDLGCGSGLLGLMALRAGARRVLFVEHGSVIEMARQTVTNAGFGDKAEFFRANSFELQLAQRVDVILCDHVGYFGFDYGVVELLADASVRFLAPGGTVIPSNIDLKLAPVESSDGRLLVDQWRDGSVPADFAWVAATSANTKHSINLAKEDLLAESTSLASIDLGKEAAPYHSWNAEFTCARDGTLSGLAGWFECTLVDDVVMTNSPEATECLARPQAFLPIETAAEIKAGEIVQATVFARPADNVIGWVVTLPERDRSYSHNTFNGLLLARDALLRAQPDRPATLNDRGKAHQVVLSYCDGERTVQEIQYLVQRDHPKLFPSAQATAAFILQTLSWDTGE